MVTGLCHQIDIHKCGNSEPGASADAQFICSLPSTVSNALVFVLAATNLPWELDLAMLRRLEKRIFVNLPDAGARRRILDTLLGGRCSPDVAMDQVQC